MRERFAAKDQVWVCPACGRTSKSDGDRYNMGDTSCVMHAVLCYRKKNDAGDWVAVSPARTPST